MHGLKSLSERQEVWCWQMQVDCLIAAVSKVYSVNTVANSKRLMFLYFLNIEFFMHMFV